MLRSKILKTKKRLSDQRWQFPTIVFGVLLLVYVLTYCLRTVGFSFAYNTVSGEIPLLSVPFSDPSFHKFAESTATFLAPTSTAVILNSSGDFYFGDLDAFASKYHLVNNKFRVRQVDGRPQVSALIENIRRWLYQRQSSDYVKNDRLLVFLPASNIPVNIVIQIMHALKTSAHFDRVVLADGLL